MPTLTKADAARQLGIARSTLHKRIDQGKISPMPDGLIDQAELVRVAAVRGHGQRTSADIHRWVGKHEGGNSNVATALRRSLFSVNA